jgi:hypothetical protein
MKNKLIISLLLFCSTTAAQTGSWNIINTKLNINNRWNLFGEAQLRSLRFYQDFHYYELKAGASFSFSKTFSLSSGFGIFDTYSPGGNFKSPQVNDEFRTWLQLNMSQYEKRLKFEHRYRAEQRWTSNGFRNRFRYRFSSVYPLNSKKVEPGTFYLNISDELFFTNRAPYFERNRFFVGAGHEFSESFSLQLGFMSQFDYRINDETGRNFLQLSFLFELDTKKKSGEKVPAAMD